MFSGASDDAVRSSRGKRNNNNYDILYSTAFELFAPVHHDQPPPVSASLIWRAVSDTAKTGKSTVFFMIGNEEFTQPNN